MKSYAVYIMTNKRNGTLYIGVTSDLKGRVWEHKNGVDRDSFTARYELKQLAYYELHEDIEEAIKKEKQIKEWQRKWKLELIEKMNPEWKDLYDDLGY